mmetsp:Transcript_30892/g.66772  ORF Transcript_30892/g.66772 Transcript_30892/m.66772 type:complete len:101 (+) Transcript_30892:4661-4963(+)
MLFPPWGMRVARSSAVAARVVASDAAAVVVDTTSSSAVDDVCLVMKARLEADAKETRGVGDDGPRADADDGSEAAAARRREMLSLIVVLEVTIQLQQVGN